MGHTQSFGVTRDTGQGGSDLSGGMASEEGKVGLYSGGGVDGAVQHGLATGKVLGPLERIPSTQRGQDRLQGSVDPLGHAVSSGVVGSGIVDGDVVPLAEVLELLGDKLASVVGHQGQGGSEVCDVLPQSLYYSLCVFSFKGEELGVPGIMIYDCEYVSVTLGAGCQIGQVNADSFKGLGHWGEFLPLLL